MQKYRSLAAWQHAHRLAVQALRTTDARATYRTNSIFDQIRRAAVSVEANVVEGYALGTVGNFRRHLRIAFASAAEVESLLGIVDEVGYLGSDETGPLRELASSALGAIHGLLRSPRLRAGR